MNRLKWIIFIACSLLSGTFQNIGLSASVEPLASIGGAVGPVQLRGDLAYVGEGCSLTILDASDPDHPRGRRQTRPGGGCG